MKKVAIVTGGSTGAGLAAAAFLRDAGCTVYEFSGRSAGTHGINHIDTEVSEETQVKEAIGKVLDREGQIDILINFTESELFGAAEFVSCEDAAALLEENLFGTVNLCRNVIPVMRGQKSGCIVNVSSMDAEIALPFRGWNAVSSSAVRAYTSVLWEELKPFGIRVCSVLPGEINRGFSDKLRKTGQGDELYGGRISRGAARLDKLTRGGLSERFVGESTAQIALKEKVSPVYALGTKQKLRYGCSRLLPERARNSLANFFYGREKAKKIDLFK